jgi:nucleoid DNA-binding protein
MTQKDLIKNLAEITGLTQADVGRVLAALALEVVTKLKSGEKVMLPALGIFSRTYRQARQTRGGFGEYKVEAGFRPRFKPVKAFKDAITL